MNEIYEVIGVRSVNGTSKRTGNVYSGMNVYLTCERAHVDGLACESIYVSQKAIDDGGYIPHVGDYVRLSYNRFGNVAGICVA